MKKLIIAAALLAATTVTAEAAVPCPRIANDIMATAAVTMGQEVFQSLVQTCERGREAKARGMSFDMLYRNTIAPINYGNTSADVSGAYGASLAQIALLEGFAQ